MTTKYLDSSGLSYFWSKIKAYIANALPTKTSDLTNDSGYITGMTILSYGNSTWQNFIDAYNANKVVYCRASSNSNPATGAQNRLAFMAYVNSATPTEVEFQYYRSVSSHSASQQGDQVYVYKLNKTNGWSVITREASSKVVAGTNMSSTYSSDTLTLNVDLSGKQDALVSGTNIKTINGNSVLGSGDLVVGGSVTSTSTPTADTIAEFDSSAHMNSADMSASDVQDFVDGLEYDGDGVLRSRIKATQDFDWDTDTPNHNPSSPQFTTQLEFINTNDNVVTHIDTHKYTYGATYSIFGTSREISGTGYYNQIGVGINDDGSFEYSIADKAKFRRAFGGVPFAHFESNNSIAVASSNISSTQTFQGASSFTNAVQSHIIGDSDFFATDTNGLKVLKHGYYQVLASVHLNGAAQSCWGMRIRNYTDSNNVGTERFGYTPTAYASISFSTIAEIGANKIIIPQIERYSTVTANSKWRPANITFDLILLNEI